MYKERKTSSKVCQQRWDDHVKNVHAEKLRNIKPSIDNSPPKAQKHLENRRKRDQINEDRLATIEKNNLILLDKMMDIMKKPSPLDNRSTSPSKSLNRGARKKEFDRINEDNQIILRKLTTAKPHYDRKDWEQFQASQEKYLENICEYPIQKNLPQNTTSLPQIRSTTSRTTTKSFSSPERSSPSSPTTKKKTTHKIKTKAPGKEPQEEQFFSDDSLSLSDLDSASDEEFLKGIAKLETGPKSNGKEKDKQEDAGSDAESLGSDLSDSFENDSDHEDHDKNDSPKSGSAKLDSPKASSARSAKDRPDSSKSGNGKIDSPKSSSSKPSSARSNGPSSSRSNKSSGRKEKEKEKEEEEEEEPDYENEFEDDDAKDSD